MNWYYAINQQRHGPVSPEEFDGLVRIGTVGPDTLVWREGMADWLPYAKIGQLPPPPLVDPGETAVCALSGKTYPKREMVEYQGKWISAEHRDEFFRGLSSDGGAAGGLSYASFGRRFLGAFLDGIVNLNLGFGLTYLWTRHFFGVGTIMMPKEVDGVSAVRFAGITLLIMVMNLVVQVSFVVFFFARFQATLGMLALRIKLVRPDGSKVSVPRIIGRHFATILSTLILLVGYLMAAWDEEGRTLHDRLADTRVVNR